MRPRMQARGYRPRARSFYAEFVANAEAEEEEENGAEDGLNGSEDFERERGDWQCTRESKKSLRKPKTLSVLATLRPKDFSDGKRVGKHESMRADFQPRREATVIGRAVAAAAVRESPIKPLSASRAQGQASTRHDCNSRAKKSSSSSCFFNLSISSLRQACQHR